MRLRLFYFADAYKNTKKGKRANFFANVLSKVKGALLLPWQPFYSFSFPNRIYKKLCELTTENDYDAIVAILNPIDSCIAANRFKKKNKNRGAGAGDGNRGGANGNGRNGNNGGNGGENETGEKPRSDRKAEVFDSSSIFN